MKLGKIIRALRRSRVRREILKMLCSASEQEVEVYPAMLASLTGASYVNILGALRGFGSRYREEYSLLSLGLVEELRLGGDMRFYRIKNPEICKILNQLKIF